MDSMGKGEEEGERRRKGRERRGLVVYKAELRQGENGTTLVEGGTGLVTAASSLSAVPVTELEEWTEMGENRTD